MNISKAEQWFFGIIAQVLTLFVVFALSTMIVVFLGNLTLDRDVNPFLSALLVGIFGSIFAGWKTESVKVGSLGILLVLGTPRLVLFFPGKYKTSWILSILTHPNFLDPIDISVSHKLTRDGVEMKGNFSIFLTPKDIRRLIEITQATKEGVAGPLTDLMNDLARDVTDELELCEIYMSKTVRDSNQFADVFTDNLVKKIREREAASSHIDDIGRLEWKYDNCFYYPYIGCEIKIVIKRFIPQYSADSDAIALELRAKLEAKATLARHTGEATAKVAAAEIVKLEIKKLNTMIKKQFPNLSDEDKSNIVLNLADQFGPDDSFRQFSVHGLKPEAEGFKNTLVKLFAQLKSAGTTGDQMVTVLTAMGLTITEDIEQILGDLLK